MGTMAFTAARGANQKLTAGTTHAEATIGKGSSVLRLVNVGSNVIFVRTYDSAEASPGVATGIDTPLAPATNPGALLYLKKPIYHDTISYLAETGSTVFHATPGEFAGA